MLPAGMYDEEEGLLFCGFLNTRVGSYDEAVDQRTQHLLMLYLQFCLSSRNQPSRS